MTREETVLGLGANCASCPFSRGGRPEKPVLGEGPADAVGVLVGEGPGPDEVELGRPFRGGTGIELDKSLEAVGLGRGRLFVTNVFCCKPPAGTKNDANTAKAVAACKPVFDAQMAPHRGKPMLLMGKAAWLGSGEKIPKGGLEKGRGFLRELRNGGKYIATWHPTYAYFHNPFESGAFEVDLARFRRLVEGTLAAEPSRLLVHPSINCLTELSAAGLPIAVDVESKPEHPSQPWTGLDPTRAKLKTIGFGNTEWGVSYIWDRLTDGEKQVIASVLLRPTVWQNGPWYDHRMLLRYGMPVGPWDDTRDMRMSLSPTSPLSLGYMASLYDDCRPWKESDEDDDKGLVFTDDFDKLCRYNAQDCVETARVWHGLLRDVESYLPDNEWIWRLYRTHKRSSVLCAQMHTRGIQVHKENRAALAEELEGEFNARLGKLREVVGSDRIGINPNSMRAILFARYRQDGIPNFGIADPFDDERWSSEGTISVDQPALLDLSTNPRTPAKAVEAIKAYWEAYAVRQAKSTFVTSEGVEHAIGPDGRLRPGWNSCGTDTGRKSCSEPNVMNLSKAKD